MDEFCLDDIQTVKSLNTSSVLFNEDEEKANEIK